MGLRDWITRTADSFESFLRGEEPVKPGSPQDLARQQERQASAARSRAKELQIEQARSGGYGFGIKPQDYERPIKQEQAAAARAPSQGWGAVGVWAPIETSDGVRELLNTQNWTLPPAQKRAEMPESAFEKDGVTELRQHDYRLSQEEWDRLDNLYRSPRGNAAGYVAPEIGTVSVDQNMPLMQLGEQESAALTWEAYDALSKDQKAAVDFNTLLVGAREKDLGMSVYMDEAKRTEYDKQVEELFGAGRGSDALAPATVDLLSQLDMSLVGQDLDEYLSLERAIDTTELGNFKFSTEQVKTMSDLINGKNPTYEQVREGRNVQAVDSAAIQQAQDVIKTAFNDPEAIALNLQTLMGQTSAILPPLGWGTASTTWKRPEDAALNQWFKDAAFALGTEDTSAMPTGVDPMEFLLGELALQPGYDANTQQAFLDYLTGITSMAKQYGSSDDQTMAALINKRAALGG